MDIKDLEKRNRELLEEIENLKRQIENLKKKKEYGLVWKEKPEEIVD